MEEQDFIQREGFEGFGELPEDLRGSSAISLPDGSYMPGIEFDSYSTNGGAYRPFIAPIPHSLTNPINFTAVNYLPRTNYESPRSQRFFAWGTAYLPPDGVYYPLLVNTSTLPPNPPQKASGGVLRVPVGFSGIISGLRQWIGDVAAFQKTDGEPDDITWRIEAGSASLFDFGNMPLIISSMDIEAKLFSIASEDTTLQVSAKNTSTGFSAQHIAVQAVLTGHWFPIDEIDDFFRNK